eukprot:6188579-Pleurochrysis_carterae.AAC.3
MTEEGAKGQRRECQVDRGMSSNARIPRNRYWEEPRGGFGPRHRIGEHLKLGENGNTVKGRAPLQLPPRSIPHRA